MLGALLVGLCLAGSPQQARAAGFYDVPSGEWYATWVGQAADKGLMSGYKDARGNLTGWFGPDDPITRAQVATVLWRMAGAPAASGASFPDVSPSDWHYAAVSWCVKAGIVTGYTAGADKGCFRPDRAVTRQELAVMVWRYAKYAGVDVSYPDPAAFRSTTDWRIVASWASDALTWTSAAGVLSGSVNADGTRSVLPGGTATRAQASKVFVVLSGRPSAPKATFTVSFNSNGGSAVKAQSVKACAKAAKPANPTRAGYAFKGWYADKGLTKAYDFGSKVTAGVTLYAKWQANSFTVTFNSNGGSAVKAQSVKAGAKATKPANPTRAGYTFKGWYAYKALTKAYDFSTAVKSNLTLYAKWQANSYTVAFEPNGGSAVSKQTVSYGGKASQPKTPTKDGAEFVGWYTDEELTQAYDFNAAVEGNLALYTKWKGQAYAVLYSDGLLSLQAGADTEEGHGSVVAQWDWDGASSPWDAEAERIYGVVARDGVPVYDASRLFYDLGRCRSMDLERLDVSTCSNFHGMFSGCFLKALDLSGWDVSSATDLGYMFYGCSSLTTLDLSGWDVSSVTSFCSGRYDLGRYGGSMFRGCLALTSLNLSGWDVSSATDLSGMFVFCSSLASLDLSGWNPSSATSLSYMFRGCSALTSLDLFGWDVSSAKSLSGMFSGCSSLASVTLGAGCGRLVSYLPSGPWYDAAGAEYSTIPAKALPGTFTRSVASAQADAAEAALFDEVVPLDDAAAVPEGLLYVVAAEGSAYELGVEYTELGGRYVGPGAYVTGYAGQADALELPLDIDGSPVVSADLSWDGEGRADMTRLSSLSFGRAEGGASSLAQLDFSGNALAVLDLSGLDALARLDCQDNPIADLSQLQAWAAQEGHEAVLPQAAASEGDAADGSAVVSGSQGAGGAADADAAGTEEAFDTVAPSDAGQAGGADGADAAVQPADSGQAGDTEGADDGDQVDGSIESSGDDQADGSDQTGDVDQSDGTDSNQAGDSSQARATDLGQAEAPSEASEPAEAEAVAEESSDGAEPSELGEEALAQAA